MIGNVDQREPVRLVIWDLDETLWRGTVTEGGIKEHVASTESTVRELARRGIVSSICSKNHRATVEAILRERGLWDFFVFPSIEWTGKGARAQAIVEALQLRPETVLFIDDSASNRAEVAAAVPGIQVMDDRAVAGLLDAALLAGKDDQGMTRLAHYKLLETRAQAHVAAGANSTAFLRSSLIRVEVDHDVEANIDRAVELINRTNQLNFTKRRLPEDPEVARAELRAELNAKSGRRAGIIRASDRFGDHGIVGFWMMDGVWREPYLIHFAFSCRTIGMGVEQWVYNKLGRPKLDIVGEVVAELDSEPDWINQVLTDAATTSIAAPPLTSVRLRGGCELQVIRHFFSFTSPQVSGSFVHPRDGQTIWASHVATLFKQPAARTAQGKAALADIGFRPEDLESDFLEPVDEPTCLVLSNSADSQVPLYRHRMLDLVAPIKMFGLDLSAPADEAALVRFCASNGLEGDRASRFRRWILNLQREWFPVSFHDVPFEAYYERLAAAVPSNALLVLLLPITFANTPAGGIMHFPDQEVTNERLRTLAMARPNIKIVETADCVRSPDELRKMSHLHFARDVYHRIYEQISTAWREQMTGPPNSPLRASTLLYASDGSEWSDRSGLKS